MKQKLKNALPYCFTVILVLFAWIILAKLQDSELFFPSPKKVLFTTVNLFKDGAFYIYLKNTLLRVIVAFIVSLLVALLMASVSKISPFFKKAFYPLVALAKVTPTVCVIFLCYMWFSSKINPIIVSSLIIIPTLYSAVLGAMETVDGDIEEMCDIFKVNKRTRFFGFYLPEIFAKVYGDVTNAFSLAIKLIIATEALSSTSNSLGVIMQLSKSYLEIDKLFAITVVTVAIGVICDVLFYYLRIVAIRWNYVRTKKHN